jgi:AAA15 family ATPase/GTPase
MLIQFNFKNFKSFKEEVSLDISSTKISEHAGHIVNIANDKLLKVAAIYGANASGKSNVYEAFGFMTYYVSESFKFGGENDGKQKNDNQYMKLIPFLFDKTSRENESTFEVFFVDNKDSSQKSYQYGFALNQDEVLEEWLYYKAKTAREYKTVFYRKKGQKIEFPGIAKNSVENINIALEKETLIVSLGAKLKISKLKMIRDWFLSNEIIDFGDPTENYFRSRMIPEGFNNDKSVQKRVVDFFSSFDEAIQGFDIEEVKTEKDDEKVYSIGSLHKMIESAEMASIPLSNESSGTLKMFALFPSLQEVFEQGSVLFVDELNARLHPLLVRNIILTFLNPEINTKNAQLIFTTHDIWQLSNDLLRRDEIWFVEKDRNGVSSLYSLADFIDESGAKIRKDESFAKNYLIGKYGAIPSLKILDMFKEE